MTTETNQPREKKNSDFGLPKAEFQPIPERGRSWVSIIAILLFALLVIGAGVSYWFFYHAPTSAREEAYLDTSQDSTADTAFIEDEELSPAPMLNVEAQRAKEPYQDFTKNAETQEKVEASSATLPARPLEKSQKGTIRKVDTPEGHYYLVVNSFIDEDLASDHAEQLAKQGIDTIILARERGSYFFCVAVAQEDTLYAAHEKIEALRAIHGNEIWVKKY